MKIFNFEQYTPQWFKQRRGVPTASDFHRIITPAKWQYAAGADSYINDLIADRYRPCYGYVDDRITTAMAEGSTMEPTARRFYEFERDVSVEQIGFALTDDERFGCSPDGLVGQPGGLECKSPRHHTHVGWLRDGVIPAQHLAQVHGCLIVTGREWWDFLSYAEGLPPLLVRVTPDEKTEALRAALNRFWDEYQTALAKVQSMFAPLPTRTVETAIGTYTEEIHEPSYW
jgi:hypothetical protein